ncbi:MAG: hypothetical protein JST84_27955 [Acidobacteria bacterium]|nr:hypothetical protein [Acidobacteriota bacterium]
MKIRQKQHESGYALLSLLVAMTIGLTIMASMLSKPTAQFTSQRESEEEMFFRAQNIGDGITKYYTFKGGLAPQNLPAKLEDLLTEFNVKGVPQHVIRKASLVDPMTGKEWKPIRLGDPLIGEFYRACKKATDEKMAVALAAGGAATQEVARLQQQMQFLTWAAQNSGISITNLNQGEDGEEGRSTTGSGFTLGGADSDSRPIVGVVSTFKKPLIRNYYGISTYDKALLMPGIQTPVMNMGAILPVVGGGGSAPTQPTETEPDTAPKLRGGQCPPGSTDPRCPRNFGLGGTTPPQ